jgi:hypothetical protein
MQIQPAPPPQFSPPSDTATDHHHQAETLVRRRVEIPTTPQQVAFPLRHYWVTRTTRLTLDTRTSRRHRATPKGTRVYSGQAIVIFIHVFIHELLRTITGHAHFGDCGAR